MKKPEEAPSATLKFDPQVRAIVDKHALLFGSLRRVIHAAIILFDKADPGEREKAILEAARILDDGPAGKKK